MRRAPLHHRAPGTPVAAQKVQELERDIMKAGSEFEVSVSCIGSGNMVKFSEDRDMPATEHGMIAFEMEGEAPYVVVNKGVCDYTDSHKKKTWQTYAAATTAPVMKALLARYSQTDKSADGPSRGAIRGTYVVAGQLTSGERQP